MQKRFIKPCTEKKFFWFVLLFKYMLYFNYFSKLEIVYKKIYNNTVNILNAFNISVHHWLHWIAENQLFVLESDRNGKVYLRMNELESASFCSFWFWSESLHSLFSHCKWPTLKISQTKMKRKSELQFGLLQSNKCDWNWKSVLCFYFLN